VRDRREATKWLRHVITASIDLLAADPSTRMTALDQSVTDLATTARRSTAGLADKMTQIQSLGASQLAAGKCQNRK
jgi:hypothetical protein